MIALEPPKTLTPSKMSAFRHCPLAFRFTAIDKIREPPTAATMLGTLVHRALELTMIEPPGQRSRDAALQSLYLAAGEVADAGDCGDVDPFGLLVDGEQLVANWFRLEDPNDVTAEACELSLTAEVGGVTLRGIIDRLDSDEEGRMVVVDYKTGRAPGETFEQDRLRGVHFYALLCREALGEIPVEVRLLHLREPLSISAYPSEQSVRAAAQQAGAIWQAVLRSCERGEFKPRPGPLCNHCHHRALCPAWAQPSGAASSGGLATP